MRQHGGRYCKREHDVGRDFRQTTGLVGGGKADFFVLQEQEALFVALDGKLYFSDPRRIDLVCL